MARKFPPAYYRALGDLLDSYGDTEFSRHDPLPAVIALVKKHLTDPEELVREVAKASLDRALDTRAEDAPGLFDDNALVPIGANSFIKRGACELKHLLSRKRIIDKNKREQDEAWARETDYLQPLIDEMLKNPLGVKVKDLHESTATTAAAAE